MKKIAHFSVIRAFSTLANKKILICPDKFKFSMTASEISQTIQSCLPSYCSSTKVQLADGGEGSLQTISKKIKGKYVTCEVNDPLFRRIQSQYFQGENNQTYIEMAKASGLQLLTFKQRNPLLTTTYGTGELVLDSLKRGNRTVNLLIGGSATNDGGIGAANALGYRFKDQNGAQLLPIGKNLQRIKKIMHENTEQKRLIESSTINVYTDVKNNFTGLNGASKVYAPQKGASPQDVDQLQRGMINLRQLFKQQFKIDVQSIIGSGAAGGLGGGCSVFFNSQLHRGIDLIFSLTNFEEMVKECDIVITGEGKVDGQTLEGKVVKGVIDRASKWGKKVVVLCAFCENSQDFKRLKNVELIELLKRQERQKIDPNLTKSRLSDFIKSHLW